MTESATHSSLAPPSDAELLRLAGKLREVGQALDRRFLDKGSDLQLFSHPRSLLEGIFESSRWNG
jgi:hypothetical protein